MNSETPDVTGCKTVTCLHAPGTEVYLLSSATGQAHRHKWHRIEWSAMFPCRYVAATCPSSGAIDCTEVWARIYSTALGALWSPHPVMRI